jgi:hypothetical protein
MSAKVAMPASVAVPAASSTTGRTLPAKPRSVSRRPVSRTHRDRGPIDRGTQQAQRWHLLGGNPGGSPRVASPSR